MRVADHHSLSGGNTMNSPTSPLPDFFYLVLEGTPTMLCIKRGVRGWHPSLTKRFDSWAQAKGAADGMNWLISRVTPLTPEVVHGMITGSMFGWGTSVEDMNAEELASEMRCFWERHSHECRTD